MTKKKKDEGAASAAPQEETAAFDFSELSKELEGLAVSGAEESVNDLRGFISTGCFVLDAEIGQGLLPGGYPVGRFTELFGTEGVGKTTFATEAMIACQQGRGTLLEWVEEDGKIVAKASERGLQPGLAILIDSEFKWPLDRAQRMGLNPKQMQRVMPKKEVKNRKEVGEARLTLEECLESLEKVLEKVKANAYFRQPDVPVLVVWDSLAASPIAAEMAGDGLQDGIASKARKVRAAMRRMTGLLAALNVTVIVVNQVYDRIGIPGVEASGGRGLKFHSSHRIQLKRESWLKIGMQDVGIISRAKAVKSSVCPPTHDVSVPVRFTTGIDDDLSLLDFFVSRGTKIPDNPIASSGAWLKLRLPEEKDPISFQYGSWSKTLAERPQLRDYLRERVMKHLRGD